MQKENKKISGADIFNTKSKILKTYAEKCFWLVSEGNNETNNFQK